MRSFKHSSVRNFSALANNGVVIHITTVFSQQVLIEHLGTVLFKQNKLIYSQQVDVCRDRSEHLK